MAKTVSECRASREIDEAIRAERNRIAEIDEVADLFDPELVYEAKYGDNPCNASELEIRAKMPKNRMRAAKNQVKTLFR